MKSEAIERPPQHQQITPGFSDPTAQHSLYDQGVSWNKVENSLTLQPQQGWRKEKMQLTALWLCLPAGQAHLVISLDTIPE